MLCDSIRYKYVSASVHHQPIISADALTMLVWRASLHFFIILRTTWTNQSILSLIKYYYFLCAILQQSTLRGVGVIGILVIYMSGFSGLKSHTITLFLEYGVYEVFCVFSLLSLVWIAMNICMHVCICLYMSYYIRGVLRVR